MGTTAMVMGLTAGAGVVTFWYNMARDQYPNVDFDVPAPVEVVYANSYETTWKTLGSVLVLDMTEQIEMSDSDAGILRTERKNLNDVSWIGSAVAKASFMYEYNVVLKRKDSSIPPSGYRFRSGKRRFL